MRGVRRRAVWLAAGLMALGAVGGQNMGPQPDSAAMRTARQALGLAKELVAESKNVPPSATWEIGYLEAWLGELDAGLATICSTEETERHGRLETLYQTGRDIGARGQVEAVQAASAKLHGADRAWLLSGLAAAQFELGETLPALLNLQQVAETDPALAANQMIDRAAVLRHDGQRVPTELLSRLLEAVRQIPNEAVDGDGQPVQASTVTRLVELHAADGNDDAALQAAEAASDPDQRQIPLLRLVTLQARAGRFDRSIDTAAKLSLEQAAPASGASYRVTGLARVVATQARAGDNEGAQTTAQIASQAAQQTVDNGVRALSMLLAAGSLVNAGQPDRITTLVSGALSDLHITDQTRRAQVLIRAACVQAAAGQADTAAVSFKSGREVVALAKTTAAYDAAVAWPAENGLVEDASAGLALRKDPADLRVGRLLLVRSLASGGYLDAALSAAEPFDLQQPEGRTAFLDAVISVAEQAPPAKRPELLSRALAVARQPYDLESLAKVAAAAGDLGLPETAIDTYATALAGATEINAAESKLGLDRFLNALSNALRRRAAAGADPGALAGSAETAAMATRDPVARAAALTVIGQTVADLGALEAGGRLLDRAAAEARVVKPDERQVRALAEEAAVAARLGFANRARASFDAAEAICDLLDAVPPELLMTLAETEAEAGRTGTQRYLLRSIMTLPNFEREGSTDLLRLSRIAAYGSLPADSLAICRRIYRINERLEAYLGLARVNLDRPVKPLRTRDWYPLPEEIEIGAKG